MPDRPLVHVVDDDQAMRDSLEFLLETGGFAVRLYDSAQPFLDCLLDLAPGCILTDIRMPDIDGLELLRRVKATGRSLPVIIMTGHGDVPLAVEAMKLGADDFIEKPFEDEALFDAIRSVLRVVEPDTPPDPMAENFKLRLLSLSQRERQVLDGIVAGQANKMIARHLNISPRTVEIYRAKLMSKMHASSLSELVRWAVRAGIA
jgi:two-component system, LuxR family, response regulator FixJ